MILFFFAKLIFPTVYGGEPAGFFLLIREKIGCNAKILAGIWNSNGTGDPFPGIWEEILYQTL